MPGDDIGHDNDIPVEPAAAIDPQHWDAGHDAIAAPVAGERLALHDEDRLPWLESAEDHFEEAGVDGRKVIGFVIGGLALLAAIVGGIWISNHHGDGKAPAADGSTLAAPAAPLKEAPKDAGGKTFEGTGDTSFAVSQGKNPPAEVAGDGKAAGAGAGADAAGAAASGTNAASKAAKPAAPALADAGGGNGVQIGAYAHQASAEAAWARLTGQYAALASQHHRITEGQADIGTVYRLQVIASDYASASALCEKLKSEGLACQVKR